MSPDNHRRPAKPGEPRPRRQAPEPWATAMRDAGLVHNDAPSIQALAARARTYTGTNTPVMETVRKWVFGERAGNIHPQVAQALADAMRMDVRKVLEWTGTAGAKREQSPWTPPPVSSRLTTEQRNVLDQAVRLFARANDELAKARGEHRDDTAPMTADVTDDGGRLTIEAGDPDGDAPPRPGDDTTRTSDIHARKRDDPGT